MEPTETSVVEVHNERRVADALVAGGDGEVPADRHMASDTSRGRRARKTNRRLASPAQPLGHADSAWSVETGTDGGLGDTAGPVCRHTA